MNTVLDEMLDGMLDVGPFALSLIWCDERSRLCVCVEGTLARRGYLFLVFNTISTQCLTLHQISFLKMG